MKSISTFLFSLISLSGSLFLAQETKENNSEKNEKYWKAESFGNYDLKCEVEDRRGSNEKHFLRPDGQVDMFVSSEPINYFENGKWNTIFNSIVEEPNGLYKYSNRSNLFQSFYPENIQNGFKTIINGQELYEMRNASMYYELNGTKVGEQSIANSGGLADKNCLTYSKVYGEFIDLKISQSGGKRKLDYIIRDKNALDQLYSNAQYLVFSEEFNLPQGWTAKLENGAIFLIDKANNVVVGYETPMVFDSKISGDKLEPLNGEKSALELSNYTTKSVRKKKQSSCDSMVASDNILYELIALDRKYVILTKVKMSYLLDENRVFPILVDPTLTATVATITTGFYFDYQVPYGPAGVATAGAPAGSAITNVNLAMNVTLLQYCCWTTYTGFCGTYHIFGFDDGVTGLYTCGGNIATWNCQNPNKTWWTEIWSADGDFYRARWGYTVTVTYETITAPTSITASANPICIGGSTTLTPVGGTANAGSTAITNQWFTGSCGGTAAGTGATLNVSPAATTNYFVRRVGQCSTTACASVLITVNPANTIAAGINRTTCINSPITSITLATTGATGATFAGLPAGVTGAWAGNVVTISGTPTASGTFNYTVTTTGGCPPATATGTITVTPLNTIAAGINRTTCINSAITSITLATTGATGATFAGLPAGVTGAWAGNVVTISGTPTASGTFNYTVTTTGGCPPATATGTITVTPLNTIAAGINRTTCINSAITSITLATTGATGATFAGLPAGVTGAWAGNVATISGTPIASGTFNYTVTTIGGCPPASTTGTITVESPLSGGLIAGDYVWKGSISNDWTAASNWLVFDGSAFNTTATQPGPNDNVFIDQLGACVTNIATISTSGNANNVTLRAGGRLNLNGAAILNVNGSFYNNSASAPNLTASTNSNVIFPTSANFVRVIGGSTPTTFDILSNNLGGGYLDINQVTTVSNTLNMNSNFWLNDRLILGSPTFIGILNHSFPSGGWIAGPSFFRRYFTTSTNTAAEGNFPLGAMPSIYWRQATLQFTSAPTTGGWIEGRFVETSLSYYNGLPIFNDSGVDVDNLMNEGYWEINPGGGLSGGTYSLTLQRDGIGIVNDPSLLRIIKSPDPHTNWIADGTHGTVTGGPTAGTISRTGMSGFSYFLIGSSNVNPLPIELTSFTALCNDEANEVNVSWSTASEHNSSHFVVDRSLDGVEWEAIGTVQAAGNSNTPLIYNLVDDAIIVRAQNVIYYRLNQFDNDGALKTYSPTTATCAGGAIGMELFPNPASSQVNIVVHGDVDASTSIVFTDMQGKEVRKIVYDEKAGKLYTVDIENLTPGVYVVSLLNGNSTNQFVRFVKR
ncbi:MAG: T9SS type A sorting domain-containing protein [Bacteroidota bacterium]